MLERQTELTFTQNQRYIYTPHCISLWAHALESLSVKMVASTHYSLILRFGMYHVLTCH